MTKMNWSKAKRIAPMEATPHQRRLESRADHMILTGTPARFPKVNSVADKAYYRSAGSVIFSDGVWKALDRNGTVIGEHLRRSEAWRRADELGMDLAGAL